MTIEEREGKAVAKLRDAHQEAVEALAGPVRGRYERYSSRSTVALLELFDAVGEYLEEESLDGTL